MLQIQKEGPTGYSATMDDPLSEDEYSLQNVSVTGDTLTGEFLAEFEKQSPRNLSIHWHPQFTLPRNGPKGMKETVYYLDYQGIRVIGLNSNIRDSIRLARQTEWLEATLKEARQRENIRWTVATFHHPMFSSVEGRNDERLREKWTPIFDEYRVDIVLQGHDHTYARGQLRNMRQGVNARSPNGGTVYVNSVSGAKMYEIKSDQWEDFRGITMQRSAENTQLYQVVRVQTDTMKYRSYTATGELYDAFDLVRPGDGGPSRMIQRPPANSLERTQENTIEYAKP
jgi:3',5'-cyclic AMP phosphodiesterase CpdA